MSTIGRWGSALLLLAGLGSVVSGCGGQRGEAASSFKDTHPLPPDTMTYATPEIGTYGGRFTIGQTSSPKTFNAIMANETSSSDVTNLLFCTLWDFNNATQQEVPLLAKSYDRSPDGLTYTWHLRRGAAFSDGHPITSDDVLFSFACAYDSVLHPSIQDLLIVGGKPMAVSAPDSYTVVTKIVAPYALMTSAIGSLRIMPKHALQSAFQKGEFAAAFNTSISPESVVTSGPFMVKQFVSGEKTVLTRNPYWFGVDAQGHRLPYLDEVVFLIAPDQNAAALKFQAGELDGLDNVRPEDYQSYEDRQQKENFTLYDLGPSLNTNFFWFNLNRVRKPTPGKKLGDTYVDPVKYSWFSNPVFRRAVSMAIDRDGIIKSVMFGEAVKNWSISTPANKAWYWPEVPHDDYNPEEAKKLLASLGWKDRNGDGVLEDTKGNPIAFTMKTNGDNVIRMQMCNFIKDDLSKVGIKCTPTGMDFNTLITNLREDFQYETMLLGLQTAVPPDPGMGQNVWRSSGLTHYWNIKQPKPETAAEAKIDQLMTANVSTNDLNERRRTWNDIQKTLNEQCFVIWLPTINTKLPVRNKFGNLQPSIIPHRLLWNIDRVFVKRPGKAA
jgi:peptide/nickel transport system substrate-binding protein